MTDKTGVTKASSDVVEAVARALYESYCATDPLDEERQPDWGRGGFKTEIMRWNAMARAALRASDPEGEK